MPSGSADLNRNPNSEDEVGSSRFRKKILLSTILITVCFVANGIAGLAVQMLLASRFGASLEMDAYIAATTIPAYLTTVLQASLVFSLLPVTVEQRVKHGAAAANTFTSAVLNTGCALAAACTLVFLVAAPTVTRIAFPNMSEQGQQLVTVMLRITSPVFLLTYVSGILTGHFQSEQKFALPALSNVVSTIIMMSTVVLLAKRMGIVCGAVGMTAGSMFTAVTMFAVFLLKGRYKLVYGIDPSIRRVIMHSLIPLLIGACFNKSIPLVERWVASGFPTGSISYLGYANKIVMTGLGLLGQGLSVSLFPVLSKAAAEGDHDRLQKVFVAGTRAILVTAIPFVVLLGIFRVPVIELLFARGSFDHAAVVGTSEALMYYLPVMVFGTLGFMAPSAFYSLKNTKAVSSTAVVMTLAYIVYCKFLGDRYLHEGVAAATSLFYATYLMALMVRLVSWQHIKLGELIRPTIYISISVLVSGSAGYFMLHMANRGNWFGILYMLVSAAIYFVMVTYVFSVHETRLLKKWIGGRLARKAAA